MTNRLNRQALARLQDKAGEVFSEIGLSRGIKKIERLAKGEDYAKTVHRSVRELHDDLPGEISVMAGLMAGLRDQVKEEIVRFAEMAPPPKPIKVEIVKERHPQGLKIEMVEVIPATDFDRFANSVQGRVALAESVLAGDMVPGGEFRAAKQELRGLKAEQEQTRQNFEETQRELLKTRREVGFLRRIVSWIREHFPNIWDHIPMDDLAKKNEANQPVVNGGPGGIVPPGL